MTIFRARTAGFCMGVSLALKKLSAELTRRTPCGEGRLLMLGPIIHNPVVLADYNARGVVCVDSVDEVQPKDTVVVRAHGIPRADELRLHSVGATVVDATCPKVKKAQLAIDEATSSGAFLLLFGEEEHPEVRGLVSYAHGEYRVFSSPTTLGPVPDVPLVLAAQTTQEQSVFSAIADRLQQRRPDARVLSTICDATAKRQKETVDIARKVDMMLVIGGHESGNTRRLADVARAEGAITLHVERMEELPPDAELASVASIGLTAGASTPGELVDEVQRRLEKLGKCLH